MFHVKQNPHRQSSAALQNAIKNPSYCEECFPLHRENLRMRGVCDPLMNMRSDRKRQGRPSKIDFWRLACDVSRETHYQHTKF